MATGLIDLTMVTFTLPVLAQIQHNLANPLLLELDTGNTLLGKPYPILLAIADFRIAQPPLDRLLTKFKDVFATIPLDVSLIGIDNHVI